MKRTVENADGIYPRTMIPLTDNMPSEDVALIIESFRPETLDSRLSQIKDTIKPLIANLTDQYSTDRQEAARELDMRIDRLLAILPDCDPREAARQGINIGVLAEKVHAMEFEPKVIHASRVQRGLGKGRDKKARATEERRKKIVAAVKARMDKNRKDSLTSAREYVAAQLGISFYSVKRATGKMKPRKKTKK